MHRHPASHSNANRADLGLAAVDVVGPDADPLGCGPSLYAEIGQGGDHPALERMDEKSYVASAPAEVEQHIGHALSGAMVGITSTAAGLDDIKASVDQFARRR